MRFSVFFFAGLLSLSGETGWSAPSPLSFLKASPIVHIRAKIEFVEKRLAQELEQRNFYLEKGSVHLLPSWNLVQIPVKFAVDLYGFVNDWEYKSLDFERAEFRARDAEDRIFRGSVGLFTYFPDRWPEGRQPGVGCALHNERFAANRLNEGCVNDSEARLSARAMFFDAEGWSPGGGTDSLAEIDFHLSPVSSRVP